MTKKPYPSDKLDQYIVRFPSGMRDRIKEAAEANNRSMNAEIISRLEESFDPNRMVVTSIDDVPELAAIKQKMDQQLAMFEEHNAATRKATEERLEQVKRATAELGQVRDWSVDEILSEITGLLTKIVGTRKAPTE